MSEQDKLSRGNLAAPTDDDVATVILTARENPNHFAKLLGYDQDHIHQSMQDYLSRSTDSTIGVPRGHGKSVQAGIREAWEIGTNPGIRIKHVCQTDDKASEQIKFVASIMDSPVFKAVFPGISIESITTTAISVLRDKIRRDPTIQGSGIYGRAGGRADILVGDDVCDLRNSVLQPSEREKVKEAWHNNWLPMRAYADGTPRTWRFFTPYHTDDLTAEWKRVAEDAGNIMWHPCRGLESPWPSVWTPERLELQRKEMGPLAYGRAYELVPISSDSLIFRGEWLDAAYYQSAHGAGTVVAAVDWAFSVKADRGGDYSVCVIGSIDSKGVVWVLDCLRIRASFPDFVRRAISACDRYGVSAIIAEGNGPQSGLCQQLAQETKISVHRLNRSKDKVTRASEVQGMVESGRLRLPCISTGRLAASVQPIRDEMVSFPVGDHDDTVDAVVDLLEHSRHRRYDSTAKPFTVTGLRNRFWRLYGTNNA